MRIHSIDLISRTTRASHRTLLIFSGGLIVVDRYDLNEKDWPLLGRDVPPDAFLEVSLVVLAFLTLSHVLQWVSDWQSYKRWFQSQKAILATFGGTDNLDILKVLQKNLSWLDDFVKSAQEDHQKESENSRPQSKLNIDSLEGKLKKLHDSFEEILNRQDRISKILDDIGPNFDAISLLAKFHIYVWYLAVPVGLSLLAGCLLVGS